MESALRLSSRGSRLSYRSERTAEHFACRKVLHFCVHQHVNQQGIDARMCVGVGGEGWWAGGGGGGRGAMHVGMRAVFYGTVFLGSLFGCVCFVLVLLFFPSYIYI